MTKQESIAVIGGGSWGTTLARLLSNQGHQVSLWEFDPERCAILEQERRLAVLPALRLPDEVTVSNSLSVTVSGKKILVLAVPSHTLRTTLNSLRQIVTPSAECVFVTGIKGIEEESGLRMSEIIQETFPSSGERIAVLSGPSHAEDVCRDLPTAIVIAAANPDFAGWIQQIFFSPCFRVYTNSDIIGVELGGALKNIYALATGIIDGLDLGDNSKAALMNRGLAEMSRLGTRMGARLSTFFGLSGMGDLVVTCMSRHSRNRAFGEKIGQGKSLEQAAKEMTMVAEGIRTTRASELLRQRYHVEMPIAQEMFAILYQGKSARSALDSLLLRQAKPEMSELGF